MPRLWTLVILVFGAASSGAIASGHAVPTIEAWCTGGIAGLYNHVSVTPGGEIRAINRPLDGEWPVVGNDLPAASNWFAALALAGPAPAVEPDDDAPVVMDAITCGLSVSGNGKVVRYDHSEVLSKIMAWVPAR